MVILLLILFLVASPVFAQDNEKKHFLIDFPVYPQTRLTLITDRIEKRDINLGNSASFLFKNVKYEYYFEPKIRVLSESVNLVFAGGLGESFSQRILRSEQSVSFETEGSIWLIDIGIDGDFYRERVFGAIKGVKYDSDFYRKSQSIIGWAGLKVGDFSDDFVSFKFGKGFAKSQAFERFRISNVDTSYFDLYRYNFWIDSGRIEVGLRQKRFRESIRITSNIFWYRPKTSDDSMLGFNHFNEYIFDGTLEVTPFLRADNFRLAIKGSKFFGSNDGLIFRSRYPDFDSMQGSRFPSLQIILRLVL